MPRKDLRMSPLGAPIAVRPERESGTLLVPAAPGSYMMSSALSAALPHRYLFNQHREGPCTAATALKNRKIR